MTETMKKNYHYTECGLDNIILVGGVEFKEDSRGARIKIHDLKGLHAVIGRMLITEKKRLCGKELRFLRHELDMTQNVLGALLGTTDQTVARWEKEENEIPGPADRLIRLIYREHVKGNKSIRDSLRRLSELDELVNEGSQIWFQDGIDGWEVVPAKAA